MIPQAQTPAKTTASRERISLAFGSFYFTPRVTETTALTQSGFFEIIARCLRGIEGVSDGHTDLGILHSRNIPIEIKPSDEDPKEKYLGPQLQLTEISFLLTIPDAIQRTIDKFARGTLSEQFDVRMSYGWGVPVSCVAVHGAAVQAPTTAARTVALYLASHVEQSAEPVAFGYIPPIYAHADFFLIPSSGQESNSQFTLQRHQPRGYHRYEYTYDPELMTDAVGSFFSQASSEIDIYFRRKDDSRLELSKWVAIEHGLESLTTAPSSPWSRMVNLVSRGRAIRRNAIRLTRFAAESQLRKSQLERSAQTTYSDNSITLARDLVQEEISARVNYPISQFSELIQMFQTTRVGELQMIGALIAALLGAAIGAGATLLAAG